MPSSARIRELVRNPLTRSLTVLFALFWGGVLGYVLIEDFSLLDAAYMTILTFTTVGFQEVRPLSDEGRIFTIFLMLGGVGTALYSLTLFFQQIMEQQFFRRRRMNAKIASLKDHYILCGYGRVGREVARAFQQEKAPVLVIDANEPAGEAAEAAGFLHITGNASDEQTLLAAGIERASGIAVTTGSDSENVFITLTARGLNPNVVVVARSSSDESNSKLRRAGADRVISPQRIGGRRIALSAIRPLAVDYFDTLFEADVDSWIEQIEVTPAHGNIVNDYVERGLQVLALKKLDGTLALTPAEHTLLEAGDRLIVVGTGSQLAPFERSQRRSRG